MREVKSSGVAIVLAIAAAWALLAPPPTAASTSLWLLWWVPACVSWTLDCRVHRATDEPAHCV
jgi:hypothetical protein